MTPCDPRAHEHNCHVALNPDSSKVQPPDPSVPLNEDGDDDKDGVKVKEKGFGQRS